MDNRWWNLNNNLLHWDQAIVSNTLVYVWNEDDGGFEMPIELGVSYKIDDVTFSGKVTYKIKNDDDFIGAKLITQESCPAEGYYSLGGGSSEFRFKSVGR